MRKHASCVRTYCERFCSGQFDAHDITHFQNALIADLTLMNERLSVGADLEQLAELDQATMSSRNQSDGALELELAQTKVSSKFSHFNNLKNLNDLK